MGRDLSDPPIDNEKLRKFFSRQIGLASKMAGAGTGVVIAYMSGVPFLGALLSPLVAQSLERAGSAIIERQLAPRQEIRAARAYIVALGQIQERVAKGEILRDDGFFDLELQTGRSIADEVSETALFAAINSTQELKVDYIALLLANIAFEAAVDPSTANFLIRTSESLSYRAFAVLKMFSDTNRANLHTRRDIVDERSPPGHSPLLAELYSLLSLGILVMKDSAADSYAHAALSPEDIDPAKLFLTELGELFARMLEVRRIPETDLTLNLLARDLRLIGLRRPAITKIDGGSF